MCARKEILDVAMGFMVQEKSKPGRVIDRGRFVNERFREGQR